MPPEPAPPGAAGAVDLRTPRHVHVVGVGGTGMSAIATVLAAMGHTVSGSDLQASGAIERLRGQGVTVVIGHSAANVTGADIVTASPAVRAENVELAEAARLGIPVVKRGEMLAAIADTRRAVAVAGTHGKTTTSSMLSLMLVEAGLHPSFLIGADVGDLATNAVWDTGAFLVLEADESFGTFAALRPELSVLTNVEPDHLDHYGTVAALERAFAHLLVQTTGRVVASADDPVAASLGAARGGVLVGEAPDADYRVADLTLARSALSFTLVGPDGALGRLAAPVPGRFNAANAALAAVAALELGVPFDPLARALARFAGVPRRFEFRGEAGGVTFVDDYAHLPGEVRAALAAAREGGWQRVIAVFQPHRFTRTASLAESFSDAFGDADALVVTDVYRAFEPPVPGVSGRLVADAVLARHPELAVAYAPNRDELRRVVAGLLRPGDVCCTLGAGDLTTLPDELMAAPSW
ncbi:MAG TPA: UDP-N-acetylmuramate--L-alanine ligase [Acidimicrobiales bacterium]|nr:UDP-N-acetylmuramate--L-alanine ligase [Acidimicrobiales bacterium]